MCYCDAKIFLQLSHAGMGQPISGIVEWASPFLEWANSQNGP